MSDWAWYYTAPSGKLKQKFKVGDGVRVGKLEGRVRATINECGKYRYQVERADGVWGFVDERDLEASNS